MNPYLWAACGFAAGAIAVIALLWLANRQKAPPPSRRDVATDRAALESIRAALDGAETDLAQRPRLRAVSSLPTLKGNP